MKEKQTSSNSEAVLDAMNVAEPLAVWWLHAPYSAHFTKPETWRRVGRKIGRNEPCPCGSGRKFKNCCVGKDERGGEDH